MKNDTQKGRWLLDMDCEKVATIGYVCSECGERTPIEMTRYCSSCGCKMYATEDDYIIYRPHKSTLEEAMNNVKYFNDIAEMCDYLVKEYEGAFAISDIYISYYGYDGRIGWETYSVTVGKMGDDNYLEKYNAPQIIGFCAGL